MPPRMVVLGIVNSAEVVSELLDSVSLDRIVVGKSNKKIRVTAGKKAVSNSKLSLLSERAVREGEKKINTVGKSSKRKKKKLGFQRRL